MKLHQLKAFLAAAETGSIRGAARRMSLSQAALTKALRELEDSLGTTLLQRSVRGIQLTGSGNKLLVRARLIARQMQLAESELRQLEGIDEGNVALGVTPLVALTILPQAIAEFQQYHGRVRLHIVEGYEGTVIPALRQGTLDFGVMIVTADQLAQDLEFDGWFSTESTVVLREGHPLGRAKRLAELADQFWLATSFGATGRGGKIATYFAKHQLPPPRNIIRCDSVVTSNALLRGTDTVTLAPLPLLDCPELKGIRRVRLAEQPPSSQFGLLSRADIPLSPAALALAARLRELAVARFSPRSR
jgi:DNA-binding transcriptional LysR family regulator